MTKRLLSNTKIKAVLFDFTGVVATVRMTLVGEDGHSPYKIELVNELANSILKLRSAGILTGLITNNDRAAIEYHAPHIKLEELFDVSVFSSDVSYSKPDPRIFLHTLEALDVLPLEAVFLDDSPYNVDAALHLGIQSVVVDSTTTALDVIDEVLEQYG